MKRNQKLHAALLIRAAALIPALALRVPVFGAPWNAPAPGVAPMHASNGSPVSGAQQMQRAFGKFPVSFVENQGQTDPRVRFVAQGHGYAFFLTPGEVTLALKKKPASTRDQENSVSGVAVSLQFLGANPDARIEGAQPAEGKVNYFHGSNPAGWHTGLTGYRQVVYRDLWPGIDLELHEKDGTLAYEFHVKPGGRIQDIRLGYRGVNGVAIDRDGGLLVRTALGTLHDDAPVSFQNIGGVRVPVKSQYVLPSSGSGEYSFAVGSEYQRAHELIIDPGIEFSTFLGGSDLDTANGIAIDASGNTYIVGWTQSTDFPTTAGAFDRTLSSPPDIFVSKLNATGTALVYSTYLGGSPTVLTRGASDPFEFGRAIAVDAAGNAYITGQTTSGDFPVTRGAFSTTLHVTQFDATDAFVTKLSPDGSRLVYSTFLGGTSLDDAFAIGLDSAGNAYVTGETTSKDFPVTAGAFQRTFTGSGFNGYVTKLNAAGSALVYSTYLNGTNTQFGQRVVVDSANNAYVMGNTSSPDFVTTSGAFSTTLAGAFDVFVLKLNATGSGLIYSTFLGGSGMDSGGGLDIDSEGNAYVSGGTASTNFPSTPGTFQSVSTVSGLASNAFVTKLNPTGTGLVYSTFLGNAGSTALAVTPEGNVWVTGATSSSTFPVTPDAFQQFYHAGPSAGAADAFISELNADASQLLYSTFLGGFNVDTGTDLRLDTVGDVYIAGSTNSVEFPVTPGVAGPVFNAGGGDGFVAKLALNGNPPPPAPVPTVASVTVTPVPVAGPAPGQPTAGTALFVTVQLTGGAPAGGAVVSLTASNPTALSLPATLTIAPGSEVGTVTAVGGTVTASTAVTITALFNGSAKAAVVTIVPPAPPATLSGLTILPSPVVGGDPSHAVLILTGPAPAGGITATFSASSPVAILPATVTVPQGQNTANFTVPTTAVNATTGVTISATAGGITKQAVLTVSPAVTTDTLTVAVSGRKGETVVSSPSGIAAAVGGSSTAPFNAGTSISLSVTDGRDAVWSGACSSGGRKAKSCAFTLNGNATVSASVQ